MHSQKAITFRSFYVLQKMGEIRTFSYQDVVDQSMHSCSRPGQVEDSCKSTVSPEERLCKMWPQREVCCDGANNRCLNIVIH
jgi:hypothetical protein